MRDRFNFDEMMVLAQKDPEMFEQRRNELLLAARSRCSGPRLKALEDLQYRLDQGRSKLRTDQFIRNCVEEIVVNMAKLDFLWKELADRSIQLVEDVNHVRDSL